MDSSQNKKMTTVDEASSKFLVDAANGGMAEVELGAMAQQKATNQRVKDFGAMMVHDHSAANEQIKSLAAQKNVTLPDSVSNDKRDDANNMNKKTGKNFDKDYMDKMVKDHENDISMFEKAVTNAKDPDVSSWADKTLKTLRMHLDSAKAVRSGLH
jgi:putative membrane protein